MNNRRKILKGTSAAVAFGLAPTVAGRQSGETTDSTEITPDDGTVSREDFEIVGTKKTKTTFEPDTITIQTTYRSQDLKKRYGMTPPKITEEKVFDRSKIPAEEDEYPRRDVVVNTQRWESNYARKDEWEQVIRNQRAESGTESGGIGIQHDHPSEDRGNCGRAVWNYTKVGDNGYETSAPINLLLFGVGMEDVETVLEDDHGWDNLENYRIPREGKRYAWDMDRSEFVGPDNEPYGEYGGWGTKEAGLSGRHHVRCYELEPGIISIQAHEDGDWDIWTQKHDVISYQSTRDKIIDIFTNNWPYLDNTGWVASGPDGWGNDGADDNHDGKAIRLEAGSNPPKEVDKNC